MNTRRNTAAEEFSWASFRLMAAWTLIFFTILSLACIAWA